MILCDNCKEEITSSPFSTKWDIDLDMGKKTLCSGCWVVLNEWICSDEHRKALEEHLKELDKEN